MKTGKKTLFRVNLETEPAVFSHFYVLGESLAVVYRRIAALENAKLVKHEHVKSVLCLAHSEPAGRPLVVADDLNNRIFIE